jgi:hypothetical protein
MDNVHVLWTMSMYHGQYDIKFVCLIYAINLLFNYIVFFVDRKTLFV